MDKQQIIKSIKILLIILLVGFSAFTIWAYTPPRPMEEAVEALQSSETVSVFEERNYLAFVPNQNASTGLILYPGGRINPKSYAPTAHNLAKEGYIVVVLTVPFNVALFAIERGTQITEVFSEIDTWAIGGHSLGGVAAAECVLRHPDLFAGLILMASYPNSDLSALNLQALSIYGTRDGLASVETITASSDLLPAATIWEEIEGGNHAYFGYYGDQSGDLEATITREQQQAQIITATSNFLSQL